MRPSIIAPTLLLLAAGAAQAVEFAGLEFHGFFSQGYVNSSENEWLVDRSTHGSFDLNDAAVNVSYDATDRLRFAVQIYASDLYGDPQTVNSGSFDQQKAAKVNLDYAYGQYTFADQFGVRVGRVKQAYGFYNEVRDIDAARSTAILPQSVYDNRDRELNYLATGLAGFGSLNLGQGGRLDWQAYWGTFNVPEDGTVAAQYESSDVSLNEITTDAVVGGQLLWTTPLEGLRLGLSYRQLQGLEADAQINPGVIVLPPGPPFFGASNPVVPLLVEIDQTDSWLGSIEYIHGDWTFQGEYQRIHYVSNYTAGDVPLWGPIFQTFLASQVSDTEGWYALSSYRLHPRFEAGAIFSMYSVNYNDRLNEDWNQYQHDYGIFASCNLTDWWTLKAEAHYVEGTALLNQAEKSTSYFPGSTPLSSEYWSYFVARTTVSF